MRLADSPDKSARVQEAFFIVKPNRDQLVEIGALLEAGVIRPTVREVVPFSDAPAAYSGGTAKRRGRGKVVVGVADDHEATRRNSPSEQGLASAQPSPRRRTVDREVMKGLETSER